MVDVVQQLLFPSKRAEKSRAKSLVSERRHPPALNVPDSGTWSSCCSLRRGAQEKEKRDLLSSWVAVSCVRREQLALASFALQPYGNKNKRKNGTKIFENSLRAKNGAASPAAAGHSPLLYPSPALLLSRESRQKTFPSSLFSGHSLANARLTPHHTRARLSQQLPCKR